MTKTVASVTGPQFPPAADMSRAKEMFQLGMQAKDKVVRFIILYGALALYALFKSAKRNRRESIQDKIDAILRHEDPGLSSSSTPSPHTLGLETIYTRIRNEFVHAGERKKDLQAAMREIEQNIVAFEGLVAKIIK